MKNTFTRALLCTVLGLVSNLIFAAANIEMSATLNDTWRTVRSTEGRDFWVTFMDNAGTSITVKQLTFQLRISTKAEKATGSIKFKNGSYSYPFEVLKDSIYAFTVPEEMRQYAYATETEAAYKGVHVVSDADVTVYACNYKDESYDATMVLPSNKTLGREYVVQTFSSDFTATEFVVVATASGTTDVYITPTVNTSNGSDQKTPIISAGKTKKVSLKQGQVYFLRAGASSSDFSGTGIYATQEVAVFTGGQFASIPGGDGTLTQDHIFEQVVPLRFYGKEFAVTVPELYNYNIARVTAIYDNTEVIVNGKKLKEALKKNETCDIEIKEDGAWIQTSYPTICYSYFTSGGENDRVEAVNGKKYKFGDPSMVYVAPIEQGLDEINISAFAIVDPDSATEASRKEVPMQHYVNVVTRTVATNAMTINGQLVTSGFKELNGNPD